MSHTTGTHRLVSILGAGIFGILALAGTTAAVGEDAAGPGGADRDDGVDIGYAKHGNVDAETEPTPGAPANWRRLLNEIDTPPRIAEAPVSDEECVFEVRYLPHTADAIDGWYRSCPGGQ